MPLAFEVLIYEFYSPTGHSPKIIIVMISNNLEMNKEILKITS